MEKYLIIPKEQIVTHHGDVVITRIALIPVGVKKIVSRPLALGEFSGHRHIAVADKQNLIEFFEDANGTYIKTTGMTIRHTLENMQWTGEHHAEVFTNGVYKISIQKVRDPFTATIENVKD